MKHSYKKIVMIESLLFLVGWILIFLLGADFPPPVGFWKIIVLVIILDMIQIPYLYYLLANLKEKPTFLKNLLFFMCGGIIVALLTSIKDVGANFVQRCIWVFLVCFASMIYGTTLWVVNRILIKK